MCWPTCKQIFLPNTTSSDFTAWSPFLILYLVFMSLSLYVTGVDFIRAEGFVFSHVADEGLLNACAGDLLRYRKQIGAEHVQIFTDIKKKHR